MDEQIVHRFDVLGKKAHDLDSFGLEFGDSGCNPAFRETSPRTLGSGATIELGFA
jgi:hypothetical protein